MDGSQKWTHKRVHLNLFNLIRRGVSVSKAATNFSEKDLIVDKSIEKSFRQELESVTLLATIFGVIILLFHIFLKLLQNVMMQSVFALIKIKSYYF